MTRGTSQNSPAAEQRDMHDLVRILNRIKGNRSRQPALNEQLLFHATALLRLFAEDKHYGALDPEAVEREAQEVSAKKARSLTLEEEVRRREADPAVNGANGASGNGEAEEAGRDA